MARLKSGSKIAHFSMINDGVSSAWVTDHFNQLLDTRQTIDNGDLTTEASVDIETETSVVLELQDSVNYVEITTIPFVADETRVVDEDLP